MSHPLGNMMDTTMSKIRDMIGANAIIGDPIQTPEANRESPFGGGSGAGVTITPIAFLIIKGEQVRMMPIAVPANSTADRIVEQLPELLDKLGDFLDGRKKPREPAE